MKIWGLEGIERNERSIPFLSLKLPNKGMIFPFHFIPSYLNFQTSRGVAKASLGWAIAQSRFVFFFIKKKIT